MKNRFIIVVLLGFFILCCGKLVIDKEYVEKDKFIFLPITDNIFADDFTETPISIEVSKDLSVENRKINVSTSAGKFPNGKQEIDIFPDREGKAQCNLISPQKAIKGLITATISSLNQSITKDIVFISAPPDNIYLSFTAKTDTTASILMKSNRKDGSVSEDSQVVFTVTPKAGVLLEEITKTNSKGEAMTTLVFPKSYRGTIKATIGTISSNEYTIK